MFGRGLGRVYRRRWLDVALDLGETGLGGLRGRHGGGVALNVSRCQTSGLPGYTAHHASNGYKRTWSSAAISTLAFAMYKDHSTDASPSPDIGRVCSREAVNCGDVRALAKGPRALRPVSEVGGDEGELRKRGSDGCGPRSYQTGERQTGIGEERRQPIDRAIREGAMATECLFLFAFCQLEVDRLQL